MFKRGGVWWTSMTYKGKRIRKSLETVNKKLAHVIEAKIKTEIVEGKYFDKPTGDNKTLNDMMEKFMKEHAPKVSVNTQKSYSVSLKHLSSFFGDAKLTAIMPKTIYEYKVLRKNAGAKAASINRELAMLSKGFNLA